MIQIFEDYFALHTGKTSYAFRVIKTGQLEHLYYGERLSFECKEDMLTLTDKPGTAPGNTCVYDQETMGYSLENIRLEMSSYGKGDIREPFLEIMHADGSVSSDFVFDKSEILDDKPSYITMPTAYFTDLDKEYVNEDISGLSIDNSSTDKDADRVLHIRMTDRHYSLSLDLYYCIFYDNDVITRMTVLNNESDKDVRIKRLLSNQVDMDGTGYVFSTFNGAWAREMGMYNQVVNAGKCVNSSYTGTSSNRSNPFVMVSKTDTNEDSGECFGFNLIYSGNHYEALEVSSYGSSRFVAGINPQNFEILLQGGSSFEAPEACMTFSTEGYNGMSANMHEFVREHIVRGEWKYKARPVLLNSWEAFYFNINEPKMLSLAKKAKDAGIELLVMDDGWFGARNDDNHSLGDWTVNKEKLPGGIQGLAEKINNIGISFGIWVEPEMVNENSNLYKKHPEWVMKVPGVSHSMGRNQMILDLGQKVVQDYIIEEMTRVFKSGNIAYVKWDMNRVVTDVYAQDLETDRQGETLHRYVVGLYRVIKHLTEAFPHILFEGCASGGNRFDLGMLAYFPQIWASDDTDAYERIKIQRGYSYGYPQSTYTCHVSGVPNHQTLRVTPLETRFNVASAGLLGYECNLSDLSKEELSDIKNQIDYYKAHRETLQYGQIYRGRSIIKDNLEEWTIVSKDKTKGMAVTVQDRVIPNMTLKRVFLKGLDEKLRYEVKVRPVKYNIKEFGDLVNAIAPVHIKQNSLLHNTLSKYYKMDGEKDTVVSNGKVLMKAGMHITHNFTGLGMNENIRNFQDMGSRIYEINIFR